MVGIYMYDYLWVFPKIVGCFPQKKHPLKNRLFHDFHHPFWGPTPIFGNTHIYLHEWLILIWHMVNVDK